MQLNITTGYAIRIIMCLARSKEILTARKISLEMNIPETYIVKIARSLRDYDLIESFNGVNGGYKLIKDPSEITLLEIIKCMEKTIKINKCLECDVCNKENKKEACKLYNYFLDVQATLEDKLMNISIKDLI